ncbi:hypothetical protein PENTCL1PPCAC_11127 [Pristionchus entomophagus]|uniref:C2H2-type domain-containing protein n=1 Tax=Pristionchus entomophagus TaxID=358040 RepID=A0AAV5T331_9BILA|nr:hypothetical protein PENTCL1PPCAC_11127 [Pristionchus entomophagus]
MLRLSTAQKRRLSKMKDQCFSVAMEKDVLPYEPKALWYLKCLPKEEELEDSQLSADEDSFGLEGLVKEEPLDDDLMPHVPPLSSISLKDEQLDCSFADNKEESSSKENFDGILTSSMDNISTMAHFTSLLPGEPKEEKMDESMIIRIDNETTRFDDPIKPEEVSLNEQTSMKNADENEIVREDKDAVMEDEIIREEGDKEDSVEYTDQDQTSPFDDSAVDNTIDDFQVETHNSKETVESEIIVNEPLNLINEEIFGVEEIDRRMNDDVKNTKDGDKSMQSMMDDFIEEENEEEEDRVDHVADTQKESSEFSDMGKRNSECNQAQEDSHEEGPSMKKSRTEKNSEKAIPQTPQCVLCEKYPSTVLGYAGHLRTAHESSLKSNRIYLLCSCGEKFHSCRKSKHSKTCNGRQFTLHKLVEKIPTTPQCILCEKYPTTTHGYADHLKTPHKTTLSLKGIYLHCSCGKNVYSFNTNHAKKCAGRQFSVHELGAKMTPQCILCEANPKTSLGYAEHLIRHHKTTLQENRIYLECVCGNEMFSRNTFDPNHNKKCDGRMFSLHKIDED